MDRISSIDKENLPCIYISLQEKYDTVRQAQL